MSEQTQYSMIIEWSILDGAYVVSFPEWERAGHLAHTHGATYAEAAQQGQEMLAFLIRSTEHEQEPLPAPVTFDSHAYAPDETADALVRESQQVMREIETLDRDAGRHAADA